jgi:lactoylglutathione lyase
MRSAWIFAVTLFACAEDLPIAGLAHIGVKTTDLEKARSFYTGVLGYEQAFEMKDASGAVSTAFFKVNDDQYLEIAPVPPPSPDERFINYGIQTTDIRRLHRMLKERGLAPSPVSEGRDGNLNCGLADPDGTRFVFVEYRPGSPQSKAREKYLSERRLSTRIMHVGVLVANLDAALAFYRDKLGFVETWRWGPVETDIKYVNLRMPGAAGDYVELCTYAGRRTRGLMGSGQHICLMVDDVAAAVPELLKRGIPDEERYRPRVGRNKLRQLNLFDPDGTRSELMEPRER